ncbi:hypothetical protein GLOIN_2v1870538 [Rhizophagus clarus]|uniref:Transmembrane protein 242 n=1 Tax=Rhizophagus clarus TaxID=94130 RepID=A0A8H3MBM8_9GLOM|nr:hypothetical protein GLOIN_2v1870538 [Rhizophagus clarus]
MVQSANNSTKIHHDTTSITKQKIQLSDIPTNSHNLILGLSAFSFFASLTGSALYTRRKASEYLRESTSLSKSTTISPSQLYSSFRFSLQAFAVGSILCVSASGLIAFGVGKMLGVRNLYEFHKKMEELIPTYTPGLRKAVRNSQDMDQQQEWKMLEQEWIEEKNKHLAEREEKKIKWKKWWRD